MLCSIHNKTMATSLQVQKYSLPICPPPILGGISIFCDDKILKITYNYGNQTTYPNQLLFCCILFTYCFLKRV